MNKALDPRERAYQLGDIDKVFLKNKGDEQELVEVRVVGFEAGRPVFEVNAGPRKGERPHHFDIVFT
jgi:hypothetical protein